LASVYEIDLASCGPLRLMVESRPARGLSAMFFGLLALVLAAFAWSWLCEIDVVVAAPGRLRPTSAPVDVALAVDPGRAAGITGGRVAEVLVEAGDTVAPGDVLARMDTRALGLEIEELVGSIRHKRAELALLVALGERQREQTAAERTRTEAEIQHASRTVSRDARSRRIDLSRTRTALSRVREREVELERLVAAGHASREDLDALRRERQGLEADARKLELGEVASVEVLQRSIDVLERSAEVARTDLEVRQRALGQEIDRLEGERRRRLLALDEATLRAPIAGVVTARNVEVGASLGASTVAFVIAPADGFVFEAIVDSADAGHLEVGMPARIAIDTFDAQKYGMIEGTVAYVSPDSAAAEQAGLRYLVKVDVPASTIGIAGREAPLRLGLGGRLRVVVAHERISSLLLSDLEDRLDVEWSP
jgi:HlyD family secretion protein